MNFKYFEIDFPELLVTIAVILFLYWWHFVWVNDVYICNGPDSIRYHKSKFCDGLDNCSTILQEVSKEDAKNKYDRSSCSLCY